MITSTTQIKSCKECGCPDLAWQTHSNIRSGVPQGRLNTSDVECQFVLGCNYCSATLAVLIRHGALGALQFADRS